MFLGTRGLSKLQMCSQNMVNIKCKCGIYIYISLFQREQNFQGAFEATPLEEKGIQAPKSGLNTPLCSLLKLEM